MIDRHVGDVEPFVAADTIRLGCTPMVNLFEHRAEPIRVTHDVSEYRVVPDVRQPRAFEVHSVTAIDSDRNESVYHPFYSLRHAGEHRQRRGFYHLHRREAGLSGGAADRASDVFLSLVDLDFTPESAAGTVLDVRTWDAISKFRIRVGPVGWEDFCRLMPTGADLVPVCQLVRSYVGCELTFDLQLILKADPDKGSGFKGVQD